MIQQFTLHNAFSLESGKTIKNLTLGYTTYGKLNKNGDNAIWVFHGFSMDTNCAIWWNEIIGEGKVIDPKKYFIICVNMPGSCYGSTGPLSINPETQTPYFKHFPFFTPLDMVKSYQHLAEHLGIKHIVLGLGPSTGGMQLLHWAIDQPDFFGAIIPMATSAKASAWMKAFNATQRMCIEADATWSKSDEQAGENGMRAARAVALLSYRHYKGYEVKQQDENSSLLFHHKVDSYQRYQGEKIAKRFNAHSYYALTQSMDAYHLGRGRSSEIEALQQIKAKTIVMGIQQDVLFPFEEQQFLANHIPCAKFFLIESDYGHDGFLLEFSKISEGIRDVI